MNKNQSKNNVVEPTTKFLAFQPRNHSRNYNKSKSNNKNHINKNLLSPCQNLGDKLLKAAIQKNQRKPHLNIKRQKTEQSMLQTSMTMDGSRCYNHPDKKGEYFLENHPSKKFCLKCNLSLNGGNNSTFITKQKHQKKHILDSFKQQLTGLRKQLMTNTDVLNSSIQLSQQTFSQHSNYINDTLNLIQEQIEQKRRQLLNNLIIAQQNLKKQYEQNLKKTKKMNKFLDRYQSDIKRFYDQIIQELPKSDFDVVMEEYQQKVSNNIKFKLKNILIENGICVYIPKVELQKVISKANVQFYQPVSDETLLRPVEASSPKQQYMNLKRNGSGSLDSKMQELMSNITLNKKQKEMKLFQKSKDLDLSIFEKKTGNFQLLNPDQPNRIRLIQDKENINLQNFTHDYMNYRSDQLGKLTFKN